MFIHSPADSVETSKVYKSSADTNGFVMNFIKAWAWRPDVFSSFATLRNQLTEHSTLSKRELAVLVCATASTLGDSYCSLAWGRTLSQQADATTAAGVINNSVDGALSERERVLAACGPHRRNFDLAGWRRGEPLCPVGSLYRALIEDVLDATALKALKGRTDFHIAVTRLPPGLPPLVGAVPPIGLPPLPTAPPVFATVPPVVAVPPVTALPPVLSGAPPIALLPPEEAPPLIAPRSTLSGSAQPLTMVTSTGKVASQRRVKGSFMTTEKRHVSAGSGQGSTIRNYLEL